MKKIIPIVLVTIFVLSTFNAAGNIINMKLTTIDVDSNKSYVISLSYPGYVIFENNGKRSIEIDDCNYLPRPTNQLIQTHDYVIITIDELVDTVASSDFINWKESLDFNVRLISINDNEISSQPGIDLAEQIRNFLREYYFEWGINYVLFVGNYEKIPMRYCYPDRNNHEFDPFDLTSGEVPTDYYYADLSSSDAESWDSDGDGFYGEFRDDDPDFQAEVSVGRIPTNDADRVAYTLGKTIAFEQDTGNWKKMH